MTTEENMADSFMVSSKAEFDALSDEDREKLFRRLCIVDYEKLSSYGRFLYRVTDIDDGL
jgi:hypothetical protein